MPCDGPATCPGCILCSRPMTVGIHRDVLPAGVTPTIDMMKCTWKYVKSTLYQCCCVFALYHDGIIMTSLIEFSILFYRLILEREGPRSLFRGLGPNLVGVAPSRYWQWYQQYSLFVANQLCKLIKNYSLKLKSREQKYMICCISDLNVKYLSSELAWLVIKW